MKKLLFAVIIICSSFTLSFSAWPKFYIDGGGGMVIESPTKAGYIISGTASIGIEFIDHFSVYFQFQMGGLKHNDYPVPFDNIDLGSMTLAVGFEYSHYFGRFGILGGISFGKYDKTYLWNGGDQYPNSEGDGFMGALNIGVSFLATQYIEPFVKFQYILGIMGYNDTAWPIDMDIAFYVGVRFNIFKTKHLDKGY